MDRKDIIIEEVCKFYGVSYEMIRNKSRVKPLPMIRQTIAFYLRTSTYLSLVKCAELIGYENHASVIYAFNQIKDGIKYYPDYAKEIKNLTFKINAQIGLNESDEPVLIAEYKDCKAYKHPFKGFLQK